MKNKLKYYSKDSSENNEILNGKEDRQNNENEQNEEKEQSEINDIGKEEEKIKESLIPKFSKKELFTKTIKYSFINWRKNLYSQIETFSFQIFDIYLPILKANLIDSITSSKTFNEIFSQFKVYISFILLKIFTLQFFEIFEYYFVKEENYKFKNLLLEKIIKKDIAFFDIFKTGELIEKLEKCENETEEDFIWTFFSLIQNIIKLSFMCYYLYKTSFKLALITIFMFLLKALSDYLEDKFTFLGDIEIRNKSDEDYHNALNQLISNIRMIKSFCKEEDEIKKIEKYKRMAQYEQNILTILIFKFSTLIEEGTEGVTLLFTGKYILEKKLTLGKFTVFKQYFNEITNSYYIIKLALRNFSKLFVIWKNFFELYDFPISINSGKNYVSKKIEGKISIKNVLFSYPLKPSVNVLKNLSFEISPGKITAICGFSGSGKTTISNLLQRFYDPNEGNILLDDINLKDYNIQYLRNNIGFVAQEPILNNGTIEENITYGINNYSKEEFNEICKLSYVDSFINDKNLFPDREKTLVGERGVKVSGGQKQRIAIARALMKKTKILIFDEATSALDAESENIIQKSIYNISKEKKLTTIIIAHRLSTIIHADEIIVIKNGTVIEKGNHKELIEKNGEYKFLFQKQLVNENEKKYYYN